MDTVETNMNAVSFEVPSQGVNLRDLIGASSVFEIDPDFAAGSYDDIILDEDSDGEDVFTSLQSTTEKLMLASPQYLSFDDLATKMIDVVPSGDVKILIVEEGTGNLLPTDAYVHIHYAAYWENETVPFDNTLAWNNGVPARLKMGGEAILPGLEMGLTAVKGPQAQFRLLLTPDVLWGRRGALPRIRPERALFCVTLVAVEDIGPVDRFNSLPSEDQKKFPVTLATVEASNTQAKNLFSKRNFIKASRNYHMSLYVLQLSEPESNEDMENVKSLTIKVYVNLAICYVKMQCPKRVIQICDKLGQLTQIKQHCQALYLYGKAFSMLGEFEDAQKFLKKALDLQPKNPDIAREMINIDKNIADSKKQEKNMWRGAFLEKKVEKEFNVDDDFSNELRETCESLSEQEGYAELKLPRRLSEDEVGCARNLLKGFEKLTLSERCVGKERKFSIIKKQ